MFAIRPATDQDFDAVLALMADFYAIEGIAFDRALFAPRLRTLLATPSLGGVLLFTAGRAAVGYAAVTFSYDMEYGGRDAFLTDLYVASEGRGRGLGQQGLAAAEAFAAANGAHALHLGVRPENAPARALYQKGGYEVVERVIMTKRLG